MLSYCFITFVYFLSFYLFFHYFICFFFVFFFLFLFFFFFFFSSRRRHTRSLRDWSSDVCSSELSRDGTRHGLDPLGLCGVAAVPRRVDRRARRRRDLRRHHPPHRLGYARPQAANHRGLTADVDDGHCELHAEQRARDRSDVGSVLRPRDGQPWLDVDRRRRAQAPDGAHGRRVQSVREPRRHRHAAGHRVRFGRDRQLLRRGCL